jgi:hypothetical protein
MGMGMVLLYPAHTLPIAILTCKIKIFFPAYYVRLTSHQKVILCYVFLNKKITREIMNIEIGILSVSCIHHVDAAAGGQFSLLKKYSYLSEFFSK